VEIFAAYPATTASIELEELERLIELAAHVAYPAMAASRLTDEFD
jgi:hypothetical protein